MSDPEKDQARYDAAMHAVQSGVAAEQGRGSQDGSPKHLRVGINARAVEHTALVRILIAKGVFTEEEYISELADEAEREKARYEQMLSEKLGTKVTLA